MEMTRKEMKRRKRSPIQKKEVKIKRTFYKKKKDARALLFAATCLSTPLSASLPGLSAPSAFVVLLPRFFAFPLAFMSNVPVLGSSGSLSATLVAVLGLSARPSPSVLCVPSLSALPSPSAALVPGLLTSPSLSTIPVPRLSAPLFPSAMPVPGSSAFPSPFAMPALYSLSFSI